MPEAITSSDSRRDLASYDILIDDSAVTDPLEVLSVSVMKEMNRIPRATLVIRDGEAAGRTFEVSNRDDFRPGRSITLKIGRDSVNEQVFKGIITRHALGIRENGESQLVVECQDGAFRMALGRRSRYFSNSRDNEVFDQLIGNYPGLSGEFSRTGIVHKELVQHHLSDWDFMLLRAEANGMLVNVNDGKITIAKPATSDPPVLEITYGISIYEFNAEMDMNTQWAKVEALSWDYGNQELFRADSESAAGFDEAGNVSGEELAGSTTLDKYEVRHSGHLQEQELRDWADGVMLRSRLAKIRGHVRIDGSAAVKTGNMVELRGVGERFEGRVFVTAVRQELGLGTWDTHIQFGLDPKIYVLLHKDIHALPASGLIGSVDGLQVGKVVQLQDDPDGQDRILVKLPLIDNEAEGIWSRVASLDAGAERGAFFRPELGDEVIVGFINGDPRDAVVLGMLHSSTMPAPLDASDDNHRKGFTTRSKMHLIFDDNTKTITIDTPAGNHIILDEEGTRIELKDQNDNKVIMDSSGITLDSPQDIIVKAGASISLEAATELKIKGLSVGAEASAEISVKGASAKMEAQGITQVKGSLVQIN